VWLARLDARSGYRFYCVLPVNFSLEFKRVIVKEDAFAADYLSPVPVSGGMKRHGRGSGRMGQAEDSPLI
jgi:hypothetical protein